MPFIVPIVAAVGTAIGAVGTFIGGLGAIGTALIGAGVAVAASYIITALSPKPEEEANQTAPGGVSFERQYGTNVVRKVACGLIGVAGHDTYINTFNSANKSLQQIYTLSDFYSTELTRVAINGNWVSFGAMDGNGYRPVTSGDFANLIRIKFLNGFQSNGADVELVNYSNPPGRWDNACTGVGISAVIVNMEYDQEKNSSFPDFFFEFKGAPLYDIRKDSTAGGSGSHRWGDVSTYEYSENPIVIEYNYRRGFSVNGDLFCGMDMLPSDLPFDKYVAAMNICDEITNGQPRYRCSILLDCDSIHVDNLKAISLSCGSMQVDGVDGSWPIVGTDQPIVIEFTDFDLIDQGQFEFIEKQSMGQLVNSVSGNYPEPEQLWSMIGYQPQIASDYVTIDRRTRDVSIDFPQVRSAKQAAQLAWIYLYENRFEAKATVTLRPRFQGVEVGDWIRWNSSSFGNRTYLVTARTLAPIESSGPRNIVLSLQERDGQIYEGVTPPPIVIPTRPGEPVYLEELQSFNVLAVSVQGENGFAQPAIRVSWLVIEDVTVSQIDLAYYPVDDAASVMHKLIPADRTVELLTTGVVGDTLYRVQARLITSPERATVYNAGKTIRTLKLGIGLAAFNQEVVYQATKTFQKIEQRIAEMDARLSSVAKSAGARQWNNKQMLQRQLMSVTGSLSASITEVMTVATDTQVAFAEYQVVVSAALDDLEASVSTVSTAVADINGRLNASWSLTLNVNGHISGLKALNDGTTSAFIIQADIFQIALPSAGAGGSARTVFTLGNVSGTTQMVLRGDFLADGVATIRTINVGYLSAISSNCGELTAGVIRSPDNKWIMDLSNTRELISD